MEGKRGLTSNQLKLIAMFTMTLDHIGLVLLPGVPLLRILGRLSMPIYAYLIAQGARHTHSRGRYLLRLLGLGALCQVVYFLAQGSLYLCILITFSLSVWLIDTVEAALENPTVRSVLPALAAIAVSVSLCVLLPMALPGTNLAVDYGLLGVALPVAAYFGALPGFALCLVLLAAASGGIQWWSLAALPLLLLYNGQRGSCRLGTFFYLYYPLHLAVIYGISLLTT